MAQPQRPNLTETAVQVDRRDPREYAGNQQASPLFDMCHHPERHPNILFFDKEIVIVDDANAKSPNHVILMPRDTSIQQIADLTRKHLPLLYRFRDQCRKEIDRMMRLDPQRIPMFMVGFHVIPSLFPLHCHVLDWSLSTGKMFAPRHWKVVFSEMFISLDQVVGEVERTGRMTVDAEAYKRAWLTQPIRCPVCPGPQRQWEADSDELAMHWRGHIRQWKQNPKALPRGVTPEKQWVPTFPVVLTTKRRGGFIGLANELDHLKKDFPNLEIHSYYTDEWSKIPKYVLDRTTIYLSTTELPPDGVCLPRLEWVHLASSGLDLLTNSPYNHRPNLQVTSSTGSGSGAIAEWVLMSTMLLGRNMLTALRNQSKHQWAPQALMGYRPLSELSVGIIGFGSIGQQVAERFLALGSKVSAMNPKGLPPSLATPGSKLSQVTIVKADGKDDGLRAFLRKQDVVVLAAPLLPETVGLLRGPELASMPKGAMLINCARGPLVDENALAESLRQGHLGGAAVDVVDEEPLGAKSPLWDLPNLIITPHISAMHDKYNHNMLKIFEENLRAHILDKPKRNLARLPVPSMSPLPPPPPPPRTAPKPAQSNPRTLSNAVHVAQESGGGSNARTAAGSGGGNTTTTSTSTNTNPGSNANDRSSTVASSSKTNNSSTGGVTLRTSSSTSIKAGSGSGTAK
ncbi:D-isomer specific 2-hydroxyacid dehydrogenase [Chaetomium strumarium]|uniref:D-isomer specific 2-hydroxyacid dehydrogenase n=1 Tax=Chaetomium strumarium TaxID=1170767 RepID=A0AAJ0M5P5_9PEZI|nr:D-isomer specific 2-hydroxyacid dehydrogenase [Chaetomium strumarium]